ncbi:response regulator transcription factor [bacterium]|nr:response regulator transcription factor [Bacteroidota bacterium]MBU1634371.1 response regulator transcription factor [bacterium]
MIKIIIVEDNNTIRHGLRLLIDGTEGYQCIADFVDCEDMLEKLEQLSPDILLMDIGLPGMSGIEGIKRVKEISPDLTILILTIYEENQLIFEALKAGASGFLVKKTPPARLLEAIKEAHTGGSPMSTHIARKVVEYFQNIKSVSSQKSEILLTPREKELLQSLVNGRNYKAIADSFYISIETVRFHFRNIYKKLHVHSQSQAVAKAIREKLI